MNLKYEFSQTMIISVERDVNENLVRLDEVAIIEKYAHTGIKIEFFESTWYLAQDFEETIKSWDIFTMDCIFEKDTIIHNTSTPAPLEANSKFLSINCSYPWRIYTKGS